MKNQKTIKKDVKKALSREDRKKNLKRNLIIGIPAILIAGICLALLFTLIRTVHTLDSLTLNTDTSLIVQNGDNINIDYVGTIDGEEFSGGSTKGKGEHLLVGSGSYIDDFEEQLIGHRVGETVDVTVTFPEDYPDDSLRNKEAVFATTINGIYQ